MLFFSFHHYKYEQQPSPWKLAEICCVIFFCIFLHHTIHNCGVVLNQGISAHCGRTSTGGTGKLAITKRPSNNTVHQPCEGYQRQKKYNRTQQRRNEWRRSKTLTSTITQQCRITLSFCVLYVSYRITLLLSETVEIYMYLQHIAFLLLKWNTR